MYGVWALRITVRRRSWAFEHFELALELEPFSNDICNWSFYEKYQTKFFDFVSNLIAPLKWHISDIFFWRSAIFSFSTKNIFFLITLIIRLPRSKVVYSCFLCSAWASLNSLFQRTSFSSEKKNFPFQIFIENKKRR